ncbi:MAG TPA: alcohol dehydrogenase catalytic domain-containing protein [Candidatus Stackebrandtia excrementipullorum]|nr:alcohol dehydrogenase catalytic domain-containing protein [Candidatus Stackebrandtia excrementipullorum]
MMGHDGEGTVVEVGRDVHNRRVGDRVAFDALCSAAAVIRVAPEAPTRAPIHAFWACTSTGCSPKPSPFPKGLCPGADRDGRTVGVGGRGRARGSTVRPQRGRKVRPGQRLRPRRAARSFGRPSP